MKKLAVAGMAAVVLAILATGFVSSAGTGGTVGDAVSDGLLGNEPNIIPWEPNNEGPA